MKTVSTPTEDSEQDGENQRCARCGDNDRDPTVMSIMTNVNIGFILPECNQQTKQQILFAIFVIDYIFFY